MARDAVRDQLELKADEVVAGLSLVLVDSRGGQPVFRSECAVERVDGDKILLSHGGSMTLGQLTSDHSYYYVPAERWASWAHSPAPAPAA